MSIFSMIVFFLIGVVVQRWTNIYDSTQTKILNYIDKYSKK